MRAMVTQIVSRHPAVGLAVGVVRDGRLEFFHGHGLANIASKSPVTEDTVFRIASITKTFTAIAVMQLWEKGLVDLDAPANAYLRAFQLVSAKAGWRPATLRHLLTHTSGLPEMVHLSRAVMYLYGESFKLGEPVPTLGDYYQGRLPLVSEPGATFRYTDHSFSTLGQIVEDVSGEPYDHYLREHIFGPLGMTDTDLIRSEQVTSHLATGYTLGRSGPKVVTDRQWLTAAASMIYSTPRDMARYLAALLSGGANDHGQILKPATQAMMFEPHYQTHPLIPGIGLAFDRYNGGGHLVVGHEGVLPGFNSQILVAPEDGVGVMAFTNGASGAMFWLPAECSHLLNQLLGVRDDVIRKDVPQRPETWGDICGWYKLSARLIDTRLRAFLGVGVEVFVRGGRLMIRVLNPIPALYRGFVLHADDDKDPYVFRIDASEFGIGTARVVFSRDTGGTMRVHFDLMPLTLQKQPAVTNPRLWAAGVIGALGVAATAAAVQRRMRSSKGR
ncbi:MAG TPA: serine hydrolase domain-containing protein [Candidatus Sulfotelmatobacter sp.]|nr:serine hydrolase domain-containing protein [Candidatus Sulfotelmatobacter sp.]